MCACVGLFVLFDIIQCFSVLWYRNLFLTVVLFPRKTLICCSGVDLCVAFVESTNHHHHCKQFLLGFSDTELPYRSWCTVMTFTNTTLICTFIVPIFSYETEQFQCIFLPEKFSLKKFIFVCPLFFMVFRICFIFLLRKCPCWQRTQFVLFSEIETSSFFE